MTTEFKYADWNPVRGTAPTYRVDDQGLITIGEIVIVNGEPVGNFCEPLDNDGVTVELIGWPHSKCASFENGRILVPLKGSRV